MKLLIGCALALFVAQITGAAEPILIAPDSHKQLFLDPRTVASTQNLHLVLGKPEKEARNPLFKADKPWENALNNLYPNVIWDEQDHAFKLWYKCVLADKDAIAKMDKPSTVHDVGWYLLYATSPDGLAWEKPALGLHPFGGDNKTNIVARDTPNVGVCKDAHDPDASRRYKMLYDIGPGQPRVRFSADGIHWGDPIEAKGFGPHDGDTHNNAFWDERLSKYIAFTKLNEDHQRTVARFESDDFVNWKSSGMVLRSTPEEGKKSQTYAMPVFRYANGYLGYVMMYHASGDHAVDCELAWSPDSIQWKRVMPGTPFLPRGPAGTYDSMCIYAQCGPPVEKDGKLLIYYGGSETAHVGWKRHCLPCLARLRIDGFAGYTCEKSDQTGELLTTIMRVSDRELRLSADVSTGGSIEVSLLDEAGRIVAESRPITSDATETPILWKTPVDATVVGKHAQLRFRLRNATVFAIKGVELIPT